MLRAWVRGLPLDAFAQSEDSQLPLRAARRPAGADGAVRRRSSRCVSEHRGADALDALPARARRRPHDRERAAARRRRLRLDAGRLRRRLRVLHDGPRRPRAPPHERRDRGAGRARARRGSACGASCSWAWASRRTTSTTCSTPSTLLGTEGDLATEEPRVLDGRRPARVRAACRSGPSSRRSRCRCTRRSPSCARSCCRARRASSPPSSSRWPTSTRARRSTRRSISGRCSKASTTATTSSKRWRRCSQGHYAVVNFIPYNTVDGADFRRPSWQRAAEMTRYLHRRGVLAKLRRSAGQDVEAGCGQLRRSARPRDSAQKLDAELGHQAAPRVGVERPVLLVADVVDADATPTSARSRSARAGRRR